MVLPLICSSDVVLKEGSYISYPNSQVKETQNDGGDQVSCLIPLPARPPASACLPTYLGDGMIRPSFRTGREGEREQRQNGLGEEQR